LCNTGEQLNQLFREVEFGGISLTASTEHINAEAGEMACGSVVPTILLMRKPQLQATAFSKSGLSLYFYSASVVGYVKPTVHMGTLVVNVVVPYPEERIQHFMLFQPVDEKDRVSGT